MSRYEIEKNVPIPIGGSRGKPFDYPLADMEVGDSFSFPLIGKLSRNGRDKAASRVSSQVMRFRRDHHEVRFKVSQFIEKKEGRCWRIK